MPVIVIRQDCSLDATVAGTCSSSSPDHTAAIATGIVVGSFAIAFLAHMFRLWQIRVAKHNALILAEREAEGRSRTSRRAEVEGSRATEG